MKKAKWISLALAASVLASTPSFAVPIDYLLDFNAQLGPSGTGSFSYDADTRLLTNLKWDFGSGIAGTIPVGSTPRLGGGTSGSLLAEMFLHTDLDPGFCSAPQLGSCRFSFLAIPSFAAPNGVNSLSISVGPAFGTSTYYSFSTATLNPFTPGVPNPNPVTFGPSVANGFVTARLAVSEPSTIALLMLGMLAALGIRRRSR